MQTLNINFLPFYLLLINRWNGIVKYVMINSPLYIDWPFHWTLGDFTIIVYDDFDQPGVHDLEWEPAEVTYENEEVIDCLPNKNKSYKFLTVKIQMANKV